MLFLDSEWQFYTQNVCFQQKKMSTTDTNIHEMHSELGYELTSS